MANLREQTAELSGYYSVKAQGVLGTYWWNERKKGSDLDILVEFHKGAPGDEKRSEARHWQTHYE